MSKHTPEPWAFVSDCGEVVPPIVSNDGGKPLRMIARLVCASTIPSHQPDEFEARANGDRIVLCVNAMQGVAHAAPGSVKQLVEAARNFKAAADALHLAQIMRCRKTLDVASERYKETFIAMNTALAAINLTKEAQR